MMTSNKLAEWLSRVVQIPSVNPSHASTPEISGEGRLATQLVEWFSAFGGQVYTEEIYPNRPSVYAIWKGKTDRWVAVDVHTDTVGVEQMTGDPFDGRIADGRVYGRGAVDTKATLGVVLAFLEAMYQNKVTPQPNILIAATADEEDGAQSAPIFADWIRKQQIPLTELMVAEPTLCRPVYGHKGGVRLEFTVKGVASHSAQPHLGKNAIHGAAHAIIALEAEHERLQTAPPGAELGPPTISVTIIGGGIGGNIVPDSCRFQVGYRMTPGEKQAEVIAQLEKTVRQSCPLPVEMQVLGGIEPFYQSPDTPWLRQLAAWCGHPPATVPYGTNAWAYGDLPGECVVLGPGSIDQAHGEVEWVEISELEKLARIYERWWGIVV
jgi:acetylornithine deacetylase/succinyl-diaminopimelate desuccinylase-like protein